MNRPEDDRTVWNGVPPVLGQRPSHSIRFVDVHEPELQTSTRHRVLESPLVLVHVQQLPQVSQVLLRVPPLGVIPRRESVRQDSQTQDTDTASEVTDQRRGEGASP